jgi:prephenate dehydrogenase
MAIASVRIVGSGLIGTSIGLGLAAKGLSVQMADADPKAQKLAQDLVGAHRIQATEMTIFALPTSELKSAAETEYALNPASKFIDIGSVKTKSIVEVTSSGIPVGRFCPTHPMAGREVGGAQSARGDLFIGRPWIISPSGVDADVVEATKEIVELLGAKVFALEAAEHDKAVALISHLPQLVASLLAKQLLHGDPNWLELAGAGLRDTTRIAASDSKLWSEITSQNRDQILPLLEMLQLDLAKTITAFKSADLVADSVSKLIDDGNSGRNRIPGKHGGKARNYTLLPVVIEDKPGQLGALFNECANAKVNIEDLAIEHSPGQFTGLITLSLSSDDAQTLFKHLLECGWNVHAPR